MFELEIFARLAVGIALYYLGIHFLSGHFRQLISLKARNFVAFHNDSKQMSLMGFLFSGLTGKNSFLSLMISSLTTSKVLKIEKTYPAILWGVNGSLLFVFLPILGTKASFLLFLGIFALLYTLNPVVKPKTSLEIVFSIFLLCFGMHVIGQTADPLSKLQWMRDFLLKSTSYTPLAFLLGAACALPPAPIVVPLTTVVLLTQNKLFPLIFSALFVCGLYAGSAWKKWMESTHQGGPKKIFSLLEGTTFLANSCVFSLLFFAEASLSLPLLSHLLSTLFPSSSFALAFFSFTSLIAASSAIYFNLRPLSEKILSLYPLDEQKDLSKTAYIHPSAMEDPEAAMDLVEVEQFRLFSLLPQYMELLRSAENFSINPSLERIHESYSKVHGEIQAFLIEFQGRDLPQDTFQRFLSLLHRNNVLTSMEKKLYVLSTNISNIRSEKSIQEISMKFVEALDAVLLMITDATTSLDSSDLELLYSITSERDDIMKQIRKSYLSQENSLDLETRSQLLETIVIFEKCVWLTRQFCSLLGEGRHYRLNAKEMGGLP